MIEFEKPVVGDPGELLTVRASSLSSFADCMARGFASSMRSLVEGAGYVLRSSPRSVSAMVGHGAHASVSADLTAIKDRRARPSSRDAEEIGILAFRADLAADDSEVLLDDTTPDRNIAEKQIRGISLVHYETIAPYSDPVSVEDRLFARVTSAGVLLSGQPDSIERSGVIRDLKTGRRGNFSFQLAGYSVLAASNGIPVSAGEIVGIPRCKPGSVLETYKDRIEGEVLAAGPVLAVFDLVGRISAAAARIEAGDPVLGVNPGGILCSPRFCAAHGTRFCVATFPGVSVAVPGSGGVR